MEAEVAVLLVHHEKKLGERDNDLDAGRGSSRLASDPQLVLRLKQASGRLQLVVAKANLGRTPDPIWLRATEAGPLEDTVGPDLEGAKKRRHRVLNFVRERGEWTNARDVEAHLRETGDPVSGKTALNCLKAMVPGHLEEREGRNRTKLFRAYMSEVGNCKSESFPTGCNNAE